MKANKVLSIAAGCALTAGLLFSFTKGDEKGKMKRYTVFHQKDGVKQHFDTLIPISSKYSVEDFLKDRGIDATKVKTINLTNMRPPMHEMDDEFVWKQEGEEGEMKRVEIRVEEENGERKITKMVDGKEVPMTQEELEKMEQHRNHMMKIRHHGGPEMNWNTEKGEQIEIQVEMDENGNKTITKKVDGKEVPLTEEEKARLEEMKKGRPMIFHGEDGEQMMIQVREPEGEDVQIKVEINEDGERKITKIVDGKEVEITPEDREKMRAHHRQHMVFIEKEMSEGAEGENQDVQVKVRVDEDGNTRVEKWVNGEKVNVSEEEMEEIRLHKPGKEGEHILIQRMEMDREHHEMDRTKHEMKREMHMMRMHSDEDYTVVLVEENISKTDADRKSAKVETIGTAKSEVKVFPNPSSGVITIAFNQKEKAKTAIKVMDVAGKVVYEENLGKFSGNYNKELDLKEFGAGTYVVEIASGEARTTKKVIIQ